MKSAFSSQRSLLYNGALVDATRDGGAKICAKWCRPFSTFLAFWYTNQLEEMRKETKLLDSKEGQR